PQVAFGHIPVAVRASNLASEAPSLHQVLARCAAGRKVETGCAVIAGGADIMLRKGNLAHASKHPNRVAEPHPLSRRVFPVVEDGIVLILRASEIAAHAEDVGEIQFGIRLRAGIVATTPNSRAHGVERFGLVEVTEIAIQPAETIEQAMMNRLVADALRQ